MNIIISIEHPAWAHQFKNLIRELKSRGHFIKVLAINKDQDLELLKNFKINYELIGNSTGKNIFDKALIFALTSFRIFIKSLFFKPDIFIGRASPMMALNSFIFRKPHIIFEDTDHAKIGLFFCKLFSRKIITNESFRSDLGKKHVRANIYKELFYLHPTYFKPNPAVLAELNLTESERFIIIRLVAWNADHDLGHSGLSKMTVQTAVAKFSEFGRVFITSENKLSEPLQKYRLKIPSEKIHDLLYYATMLYGESATMATEAAMLGTHAIYCDFTGRGYTDELEEKYNLVYNFRLDETSQENSINKAQELLKNKDIWTLGKQRREKLLSDKSDGTQYMLKTLDEYFTK